MSITRRQLLAGTAAAGAAAAIGALVGQADPGKRTTPASTASGGIDPTRGILVLVTLYGGNDGLNTVVPAQNPAYRSARGALALPEAKVLSLSDGLSLHPSLTGVKQLWDAGQVAIVRGVGYPNPIRSHFRSMDVWQTGQPDQLGTTGWLGRWLDTHGNPDPLLALSTTPTLPLLLQGTKTAGAALLPGAGTVPIAGAELDAYKRLNAPTGDDLAGRLHQTGTDLLTVSSRLHEALAAVPADATPSNGGALEPPATSAPAPKAKGGAARTGLAAQMDTIARLIKAGIPTRVYSASLGGFDTHVTELDNHARLLTELDQGITALTTALKGVPMAEHVILAVYSEFGRRVAANASAGTDHGTAAPVLVVGQHVAGGFHGDEPSLTDLDEGDLRHTVDLRSVYATLLTKVLGADPSRILGQAPAPPISFL